MIIQNLTNTMNGPIGQMITPHISGKALASMVEDMFELQRFDLMQPNVAVHENAETQAMANTTAETNMVEAETPGVADNEPE
jgi:hypothetical protein